MSDKDNLPDLRAGVYRHYKGPLYLVLGYGHDANTDSLYRGTVDNVQEIEFEWLGHTGRDVVVYIGLQLDRAHTGPRISVRDVEDFFALVCTMHEGMAWHSKEHEEVTAEQRAGGILDERKHQEEACVARFTYLGPEYFAGMERT